MQARTVTPQQLADMLGVCKKTAEKMIANHPNRINIGTASKNYWRLPVELTEELVSGGCEEFKHSLQEVGKPKAKRKPRGIPKPAKPASRKKPLGRLGAGTPYVQYR